MGEVKIGNRIVGDGHKCFIIAEIGINHNGDLKLAKELILMAQHYGCDAVKFQKRTIDVVYTQKELEMPRPNPFGETNGDLKRGLEFNYEQYAKLDNFCKEIGIMWFASCWDEKAVDFIEQFDPPCFKIASASLTDDSLLKHTKKLKKPILLSTGMSSIVEIKHALEIIGQKNTILYHCTSTYPTDEHELNLNVILDFKKRFACPIGYSGHEKGVTPSIIAASMGAVSIERHITTDRTLWGSDHAASLEPEGLRRLVRDIRLLPVIKGNGKKVVYNSEKPIIKKLRRVGAVV